MKAKKFIENKREGEYEIIRNHIKDIAVTTEEIDTVCNDILWIYDDPENAFFHFGVAIGWDNDIAFIEIDKFVDGIKEHIKDRKSEDEDELLDKDKKSLLYIVDKLSSNMDYTLYP